MNADFRRFNTLSLNAFEEWPAAAVGRKLGERTRI
jgi:hypothetical protein